MENTCYHCIYADFEERDLDDGRISVAAYGTCSRTKNKIFLMDKPCGLFEKSGKKHKILKF